ncbi:MAG: hypothetical protein ACPF9E_10595, partial [Alteromonas oceani]
KAAFSHVKILVLLGLFALYVCLELALNVLLIDMYANSFELVLGDYKLSAERLELFGRTLSGFGLALSCVAFFPFHTIPALTSAKLIKEGEAPQPHHLNPLAKWCVRPLSLLLLWLIFVPGLRLAVDIKVDQTTNEQKLSAVRAVVYKEAYLAQAVSIENFPEFDEIVSDPKRRDLMVALIPSLAFFSNGFDQLIANNLNDVANNFMLNRQEDDFIQNAIPLTREFDATYETEWQRYQTATAAYEVAYQKENDHYAREQERVAVLKEGNDFVNRVWQRYAEELNKASSYREEYAANETIRGQFRSVRDKAMKSSCRSACEKSYREAFAQYLNELKFEDGGGFGIYLTEEDVILNKIFKSKTTLEMMFSRGRKNYLARSYGIPEEMLYEEYLTSGIAQDHLRQYLVDTKELALPDNWQVDDMQALIDAIASKYEGLAAREWQRYLESSELDFAEPGLTRLQFATHPKITQLAQQKLGRYYLASFTPGISESRYKTLWLDSQDNLSFIRMITSTAATTAFSSGGSMFELGRDAVKLAVIPPLSIFASLVAVIMLFIKISRYLAFKKPGYMLLVLVAAIGGLGIPTYNALMQDNAYHEMTTRFARQVSQENQHDQAFTTLFGYFLDIESGLYERYQNLKLVRQVRNQIFIAPPEQNSEDVTHTPGPLRHLDNRLYPLLAWVASLQLDQDVVKPFDANITVLKQDLNVGAYLGLYLNKNTVTGVEMPNFMNDTDLGLLAEQKYFYQPEWHKMAYEFVNNADDHEYWLSLAQGELGKESLIDNLERRMSVYLNQKPHLVELLNQLKGQGVSNLILVKLNEQSHYRCFVLPAIDANMIYQSVRSSFTDFQELPDCKVSI